MNENPNEPAGQKDPLPIFLWAFLAFVPSLVGIWFIDNPGPGKPTWLGQLLLLVNAVCSLLSGIGLLSRMKQKSARIILGVILGAVFFVLNVVIVVFVGCSKMGPI